MDTPRTKQLAIAISFGILSFLSLVICLSGLFGLVRGRGGHYEAIMLPVVSGLTGILLGDFALRIWRLK